MKQKRVFYRVQTPAGYSDINCATLESAKESYDNWGSCPHGTPENKAYWREQHKLCKVVKVTEIVEDVEV